MRDPKRINPILQKFEKIWNQYPDQRFGQLVYNLFTTDNKNMFYVEDTDFESTLDNLLNNNQEKSNNKIITLKCSCCKKSVSNKYIFIHKDGKSHLCFDCY